MAAVQTESSLPEQHETISEERKTKAEELKNSANELFKNAKYTDATDFYTQAIELNPFIAAYYGNRSIAYLRSECYGYALNDATKALHIDNKYIKGYYRRAAANMALGKFKLALKDYETVVKVHPKDSDAEIKFVECSKIVKRQAFCKAIAINDKKQSATENISLETIILDSSYNGPKWETDPMSPKLMEEIIEHFKAQKLIHKKYAYKILLQIKSYFETQPTLVDINFPEGGKFTICGDVHGQFYDLLNIFKLNGLPSVDNPYLFNGDFVDRGSFSVEVIFTLFGYKLLYPDHFFMARGNHETLTMNQMYGFEGEVKSKYTSQMFDIFSEIFNLLPLAHLINDNILVMHGGIFSNDNVTLDDIRKVSRNRQPPEEGIMCELLWSDPQTMKGRSPSKRGVGLQFGPDVTEAFLTKNKLQCIIRSHEVKDEGYEVAHDGRCITIFSAPNYCDQMGNKGAFMTLLSDLKPHFTTYEAVPHPKVKPMAYASPLFGLF